MHLESIETKENTGGMSWDAFPPDWYVISIFFVILADFSLFFTILAVLHAFPCIWQRWGHERMSEGWAEIAIPHKRCVISILTHFSLGFNYSYRF